MIDQRTHNPHTICMAGCSKFGMGIVAAVAVVMLQATIVSGAWPPVKLKSGTCTTGDEYVYPYWSFCSAPATLVTPYHYVSASGLGGLEPEWDESNSTYYVRFTDDSTSTGAAYEAVVDPTSSTSTDVLLVNSTVYIYNAVSGRALQWRQESTDEFFLIEQEVSSITEGAAFRFLLAEDTLLPCPLIYPPAQCNAYYLVSDPASSTYTDAGLLAFTEEAATYVKAAPSGSKGDLPILVVNSDSTTARPVPKIRTVTA